MWNLSSEGVKLSFLSFLQIIGDLIFIIIFGTSYGSLTPSGVWALWWAAASFWLRRLWCERSSGPPMPYNPATAAINQQRTFSCLPTFLLIYREFSSLYGLVFVLILSSHCRHTRLCINKWWCFEGKTSSCQSFFINWLHSWVYYILSIFITQHLGTANFFCRQNLRFLIDWDSNKLCDESWIEEKERRFVLWKNNWLSRTVFPHS